MIAKGRLTKEAAAVLKEMSGIKGSSSITEAEIEFREVPYFLVSRSRVNWTEEQGDVNEIQILWASESGLSVDPLNEPTKDKDDPTQALRHTLIPWSNVLSLTLIRNEFGS